MKEMMRDIKAGGVLYGKVELKGRILYDKATKKRIGRVDALTSTSGGVNSSSITNVFYDEFIPLRRDPIEDEQRIFNNYLANTFRDRRFIGRVIMAGNSHTINIVYLNPLNID